MESVVEQLRAQIRRIEGRPAVSARYLASGRPEVDALLAGGGFKCGAISQLVGSRASGKTTVALSAIAVAIEHGGVAAFVDGAHDLYPPAAHALGVKLERLLIVRPPSLALGLWSSEVLVSSGAFRVVVVQLPELTEVRREMETPIRKVVLATEKSGGTVLWLGERLLRIPSAARLAIAEGGSRVHAA